MQTKFQVMISYERALAISLNHAIIKGVEEVGYLDAVNRVLAEDLRADMPMPPFDKSAMDGYACRRSDLGQELEVVEVIQAGHEPTQRIKSGQCAQIMTGAIVPEGADTVIMVEHTVMISSTHIKFTGSTTRSNICPIGEDVKAGDVVLHKGTLISDRHIPVLASIGAVRLPVYQQPVVSVVATGTELVEPEFVPGRSQIRNSNAAQMLIQLKQTGIQAQYFGIAPDDEIETNRILSEALQRADLLILSGGVSMGEFDFVPKVLTQLGFDLKYQKIAVQPGKPTTFGVSDKKFVFALPGNPVSSFIQYEIMVKPFILKCMGNDYAPPAWRLPAGEVFARKKADRMAWIPVRISPDGKVVAVEYHGSAHIFSLEKANGLIYFNVGQFRIEEGDLVDVRPI